MLGFCQQSVCGSLPQPSSHHCSKTGFWHAVAGGHCQFPARGDAPLRTGGHDVDLLRDEVAGLRERGVTVAAGGQLGEVQRVVLHRRGGCQSCRRVLFLVSM